MLIPISGTIVIGATVAIGRSGQNGTAPAAGKVRQREHSRSATGHARSEVHSPSTMASEAAVRAKVRAVLRRRTPRPLAIEGPSGAGKTRLLREEAPESGYPRWCSAREIVDEAVEAIRGERYSEFEAALAMDPRPLVIEHLEDLRAKVRTRAELRRALHLRAAKGGATILTLTSGRSRTEIVRWLARWADVTSLGRSA